MKQIIKYFEGKSRKFTIIFFSSILIVLLIGSGWVLAIHRGNLVEKARAEQSMARVYNPTTRDFLFTNILDVNSKDHFRVLSDELLKMSIVMKNRIYLRSSDMIKKWDDLMSENKLNIPAIATQNFFYRQSISIFSYLSEYEYLTPAEEEILKEIREIWNKADKYIIDNKLEFVGISTHYSQSNYGGGPSGIPALTNIKIYNPSASMIARHGYNLIKDLCRVPRTYNSFFNENISKIGLIDENGTELFYDDSAIINTFTNIFRESKFYQVNEYKEQDGYLEIRLYDDNNHMFLPVRMQIGSDYVTIDGITNTYDYSTLQKNEEIWAEWGYLTKVNGVYRVDSQFISDINEFVASIIK